MMAFDFANAGQFHELLVDPQIRPYSSAAIVTLTRSDHGSAKTRDERKTSTHEIVGDDRDDLGIENAHRLAY
jgi:hypothetical protein